MAVLARMWAVLVAALFLTTLCAQKVSKNPTDTITSGGDNTRSGYMDNHNMDPNVVRSGSFNMIWRQKLLGNWNGFTEQIYAQPLVYTPDGGTGKQYLYVISQMNIAYILDAVTGAIVTHRQLKIPFLVTPDLEGCNDIADCVGSTATGVIDPDTGTWYVTTKTYEDQSKTTAQGLKAGRYYIFALDTLTLETRPNFPIPLEGVVGDNAPWRVFEGGKHHQRPALLQVGEYVYAGFASHCVQWNFTGWIMGWHATEGRLVSRFAMEGGRERDGIGGGVWMSGAGLASDNPGRMFFASGNGYASQLADDPVPGRQPPTALEEAVVNMAINEDGSLTPTDFFMPWEKRDLDGMDKDLGTSGFVLLPPDVFSTAGVKRIGTVAGKTGKLYFLNLDDLGGYQMGPNRKDKALQVIEMAGPVFASAGAWPFDGGYVYVTPVGHQTVAFRFGQNARGEPAFSQAGVTAESAAGRQGVGHATVTSLGGQPGSGILWICDVDGSNLRAYGTVPEDGILPTYGLFNNVGQAKFSRPTFGDGRVYLTSHTGFVTGFGSPVNLPLECGSPYDAGTVNIGDSSSTAISCRAKVALTVDAVDADLAGNFRPHGFTVPRVLAVGEEFGLSCDFTPQTVGPLSTNINVRTTNVGGGGQAGGGQAGGGGGGGGVGGGQAGMYAANTPVVIRGVARSQSPILAVQPDVLSFGEFVLESDSAGKSLQFTISNSGESPLIITSYRVSVESAAGPFLAGPPMAAGLPFTFLDLPALNSSIAGRSSVSTTVNFNATAAGYFTAYLAIGTNGGARNVGAFGTAGTAPRARLEWQAADGAWVEYRAGVPLAFGPVPLGSQQFRTLRLSNLGGTTLTTTISKPPVSGALAAVNALGALAEGSQIGPGRFEEATLICSPPKSQVNEDPTTLRAVWTMNNNDAGFGKHEIEFTCSGASAQVGPVDAASGLAYFRYLGCYKDADPARNLEELLYYSVDNTNGRCQADCAADPRGFSLAATQYEGECWCGTKLPKTKVADTACQFLCRGDFTQYCGGDGAYMSLFADSRAGSPLPPLPSSSSSSSSSPPASSSSSSSSSYPTSDPTSAPTSTPSPPVATPRPDFVYLGCANEGTGGRALAKDATASPTLTIESCQDYCTAKGHPLSGMEYSTECYCGLELEHGSVLGGSTGCAMACGGNPDEICGGSGALSIYNNTALLPPRAPAVVPAVDNFLSQGCYTEGLGEHALAGATTAAADMTVAACVGFCKLGGFRFAGVEYSTECYCGAAIAATAARAPGAECNMLCGGDPLAFCGGPGRLNIYAAPISNSTSSSSPPTSSPTSSPPPPSTIITPVPTPTARPDFVYLGCANEGTGGRALAKDSFADPAMTLELCQDFCTARGQALSGVEFATECYCGTVLENGSAVGGPAQCTMACGGDPAAVCGGPGALSVYNNTALLPPTAPTTLPGVGTYLSLGCYTEGVAERALAGAATAGADMTVAACVGFCEAAGYRYAGLEYSTECYCGAAIAATAAEAAPADCGMVCGGDRLSYCGGSGRLNVYAAPAASVSASPTASPSAGPSSPPSPSPSPPPPPPPAWQYIGCANETDGRSLSALALAGTMTPQTCQTFCLAHDFPLAGTEAGDQCFCGTALQNGATLDHTGCDSPCSGDPAATCGGPARLGVFNYTLPLPAVIAPAVGPFFAKGCYTEGITERALGGAALVQPELTPESCVAACRAGNFTLAGVEYGSECYCGNALSAQAVKVDESQCGMLCAGNQRTYCGAGNRLIVYQKGNFTLVPQPTG